MAGLDFLTISTKCSKKGTVEVYPKFIIKKSSDLMIRGGDFYAIWVEQLGLWSTDEDDALELIDAELARYAETQRSKYDGNVRVLSVRDSETGMIDNWHKYCQKQMRDSFHMLDEKLIFSNAATNKKDYASKRLSYPLEDGDISAYDKLMSTLYSVEERHKIEWAIGSIVSGESKKLQKFMVLYGSAGTGKSTVLNIVQQLFDGYYATFDAKALGSANAAFALEPFKTNPLIAIQHDGDLSRIEDNTRLNSLVSHELMTVNEKFKGMYSNRFKCFLFMGTNKPVKITDAKSGLIRRLIDVSPTGNKLSAREYKTVTKQVGFELGAIAFHCKNVYLDNPNYYDSYIPIAMMGASNDFYNFVIDSYSVFKKENGTTLKAAWEMYKTYCDDAKVGYPVSQRVFKEELKSYFDDYKERFNMDDGTRVRSYYVGFKTSKFEEGKNDEQQVSSSWIRFGEGGGSIFDQSCSVCPSQYASAKDTPSKRWDDVTTKLSDIDTSRLHYVKVPENHIVIDFDIPDESGNKCLEKNIEAASKWPPTYAELSKSGAGVHLHYIYTGDPSKLSRVYDDHIEIKVFSGKSSLRRKLTKCNDLPIATIGSGLPLKGEKMVNFEAVKNEKALRTIIKRNLNKEIHPGTKPSIDFIFKVLEDAYNGNLCYDVSDMRNDVFAFAANSTHRADYCIKLVNKMHFRSEEPSENENTDEVPLVFYDVEVFPNLFLVNWKLQGEGKKVVRMINPKPSDIENLIKYNLVGFNCRRYDNHMLYACMLGWTNEQLYNLSQKIVSSKKGENRDCFFGEAYNISYTDVYDFASTKQSLKKWEIQLGIHHQELGLPWDKPVPEELWETVAEYCDNDVLATEAVFNNKDIQADWLARQILADIAGMTVNDTTNSLTTRIIFGKEKHPKLVYTDLATGEQFPESSETRTDIIQAFPGYEFKDGKNMYRGTDLGLGGYAIGWPGIYGNVALLDVASLHPHSATAMNCFGEYTKNFDDLLETRIHIKHKEFDKAKQLFNGKLSKYLDDPAQAKALSKALKIAINSVYGLTSASFDNPFRDIRNKNNIVALRGALFMRTLQDEVTNRGFKVVHIKTDSIKIADATPKIIQFCMEFAEKYGYQFEHEATYDRICLVNNAVYIARYKDKDWCKDVYGYIPENNEEHSNMWTATGTQFQIPYVFKTLFSKEDILFEDKCETKSVKTAIYLDMNESLHEGEHDYHFVGKVGQFCPIKPGCGGGDLRREAVDKDGNVKYDTVTGAKGYRWLESEMVRELNKESDIDRSYYDKLVDEAIYGREEGSKRIPGISDFGDFEWFVSEEPYYPIMELQDLPWKAECGRDSCIDCPNLIGNRLNIACKLGYDNGDLVAMNNSDDFSKR